MAVTRFWSALTFHSRVLLLIVGVLILALASASGAMFFAAKRTSLGLAEQQLALTNRLVQEALETRDQQLRESTTALAGDFGFREAVASNDPPTIASALENQRARLHADVAVIIDGMGTVSARTGIDRLDWNSPTLSNALIKIRTNKQYPGVLYVGGSLLQMVIVPVKAPDTVGWVGMGFYLGNPFVEQIKDTARIDISLLGYTAGSRVEVVASTLPADARASLQEAAPSLYRNAGGINSLRMARDDFLTLSGVSEGVVGDEFGVVVQMPMGAVVAPMMALAKQCILSGLVIIVLCLVAAFFSARMLAEPVRALASAARSLSLSKRHREDAPFRGDDELAHVAEAFHALARRAHYDALTGLPNRLLLKNRLTDSLLRMKNAKLPLAVVFIDLDGFKNINDTLGHEMGDLVLRKTAQRLSRLVTLPNTVARLGGDEFVVVLEGVQESAAIDTVNRLVGYVSTPMKSSSGAIKVGMSAGIAMYPSLSLDRESLLKHADAAMYQSKSRKAGPVVAVRNQSLTAAVSAASDPPIVTMEEDSDDVIQSGQWKGRDLSTQITRILAPVPPVYPNGQPAPIPDDERERLRALIGLKLLDSPRSAPFDRVTRIAARALRVPIVLISLVDESRQWFLSRVGITVTQTSREASFCAHAVYSREPLVVPDASLDPRFAGNALVTGAPYIRAYAGVPIFSKSGHALGTLCAAAKTARGFSDEDMDILRDLTFMVEDLVRAFERPASPTPVAGRGGTKKLLT